LRKKTRLGVAVGGLVLAFAAVAVASPGLVQVADIKLTTSKPGKSTGVSAVLSHTDPGAQPPGNIPASVQFVIKLPAGTRTDTRAAPQCNLTETEISNNECPANTVVGKGSVKANVVYGPQGPIEQDIPGTATAYNRRGALALRVVTDATPTAPSQTVPIITPLSKKGVLTVNVPQLHPGGAQSKVILTEVRLTINKKSKTVGTGRKRKKIYLIRSPKTCNGTWTTNTHDEYDDGDSRDVQATQPCQRPRRR